MKGCTSDGDELPREPLLQLIWNAAAPTSK
jgi:hypothetical protein